MKLHTLCSAMAAILFLADAAPVQAATFHLGNPAPQLRLASVDEVSASAHGAMFLRSGTVNLIDDADIVAALQNADSLSILLFADLPVAAAKSAARATGSGGSYWIGELTNSRHGTLDLLWLNGHLTGTVRDYDANRVYDITSAAQGQIKVVALDLLNDPTPNEDCFAHSDELEEEEQQGEQLITPRATVASATSANPALVDILITYPTQVANLMGTTEEARKAKIEEIIAQTNQIFINSQVHITFRLAGHAINDSIPADVSTTAQIRDGYGIADLRKQCGADIVSHWNFSGTAGIGYVGSPTAAASVGFNTSKYSEVISRYTFAHECGHNLGARHDRYEVYKNDRQTITATPGYQFGKCFLEYRTVMAYDNSKYLPNADAQSRSRIMHYSNPDVLYNGVPTGVAGETPVDTGEGGPANNARYINECAKQTESWMLALTVVGGTGSGYYMAKDRVNIVATPSANDSTFLYWSGAKDIFNSGKNADSIKNSTAIRMPAYDLTITAHYLKKATSTPIDTAPIDTAPADTAPADTIILADVFIATFTAIDAASKPIAGAIITLGDSSKNTNSNGVCTFTNLSNGDYRYTVTCAGYVADNGSVIINGGNKNIELKLAADVSADAIANSYLPLLHAYPNPISNNELVVENEELKAGDAIEVYALNGALVKAFRAVGKKTAIDFSAISAGTYIVRAGSRAAKIVRR